MINKGYIIVIVIVLCCIAYFNFRDREKATAKPGKKAASAASKTGGKAAAASKPAPKKAATAAAAAPSGGLSPNSLFKAVHGPMSEGMTHEEFTEAVPAYDEGMMYIEIKQLYAGGKTPTAADYARVMKSEGL